MALACSVALLLGSIAAAQQPPSLVRARVHVVVIGEFPREWVDPIVRALENDLAVQVVIEPDAIPLPSSAYYAPRRRYKADRLLAFLNARFEGQPREERVLGLTSRDISTHTERFADWGILGLADLHGRAAVVSSFRMQRRARSPEQSRWRMTTTAVHEVGHVLGLPHCTESRCLMRDAEGTMDTVDAGDGRLGPSCRADLERFSPRNVPRR